MPFAFRVYATYEVDSALSDKKLHTILDKLNPELRSREEIDGKKRIREFYAMTPGDAYSILEAIAEINNYTHRLKKWKATAAEQRDENTAQENREAHQERLSPFAFSKCRIGAGEQVEFFCPGNAHSGELCTVVDDKHVSYNGETWSLTGLATMFLGKSSSAGGPGPKYYKYHGEWLTDLRRRMEARE